MEDYMVFTEDKYGTVHAGTVEATSAGRACEYVAAKRAEAGVGNHPVIGAVRVEARSSKYFGGQRVQGINVTEVKPEPVPSTFKATRTAFAAGVN